MGRISTLVIAAPLLLVGARGAFAQDVPQTLEPGVTAPARSAPAPAPAPQPQTVVIPVPEGTTLPPPAEDESGFFYLPDDFVTDPQQEGFQPGPAPEVHEVRSGDTLWDICFLYFNNPWDWPRIWSYNPEITNPHWIYPGDLVRLYAEGEGPRVNDLTPLDNLPVDPEGDFEDPEAPLIVGNQNPRPSRDEGVRLRQLTFVGQEVRENSFTIVGAIEERSLLSAGDSVYLEYPEDRPPEQGKRYAIYTETVPVRHPDNKSAVTDVGSYARILGELQVVSVREGKRARAFITDSFDVIERGDKVGPLRSTFRTVEPQPNEVELQGTLVALVGGEQLIGENQVVFLDRGSEDGLRVGNRLYVVRRGDARGTTTSYFEGIGQNDQRFPARAIGEVMVVETGKKVATALVTLSLQEFGVGDRVLMRKTAP